MVWHATYLSPEFREARRKKLAYLYEWNGSDLQKQIQSDQEEMAKYDVLFLGIYAGSSSLPEVGKNDKIWKIVLQAGDHNPVTSVAFEKISITQLEKTLYPYLDKWSQAYMIRFPKSIQGDEVIRLRMTGLPARSELVWK